MRDRVLVTRTADGGGLSIALAAADFRAVEVPLLEISLDVAAMLSAAAAFPVCDRVVVPSVAGADALALALPGTWRGVPCAAVGSATRRRLIHHDRLVPLMADTSAELMSALGDVSGQVIVLPRGDVAGPRFADALRAAGAQVVDILAYRNTEPAGAADQILAHLPVPYTVLLSASAARRLAQIVGPEVQSLGRVVALGHSTAAAAGDAGLPVHATATPPNATGLVQSLISLRGTKIGS